MNPRTLTLAVAAILAVEAFVVGVIVSEVPRVALPVTADFGGGIRLAEVDLGVAVVVLLAFTAVCRAAGAVWASPVIRWVEWSQVSGVTVFLVAQLNGVRDVTALVALYALAAGATLFLVLQERGGASRWPFSFGAAVGIVPWGVIALYQVGEIVVGGDPAIIVRVITLIALVSAAAYWFAALRTGFSERAHVITVTMTTMVFALLVAAGLAAETALSAVR